MFDFGPTSEQLTFARNIKKLCDGMNLQGPSVSESGQFPWDGWKELADLGVLGIGSSEGGGAMDIVVAMEALGARLFPGPLFETVFLAQVLRGDELNEIIGGTQTVSMEVDSFFPWGADAKWLLRIEERNLVVLDKTATGPTIRSLAGNPWVRLETTLNRRIAVSSKAFSYMDLAMAAYVSSAAQECLVKAAEYAGHRRQFGKSIGEFQAVSHALARCDARISSAQSLVRLAAWELDRNVGSPRKSLFARLAAEKAAVEGTLTCHQVFGAIGFSEEFEIWRFSTVVRERSASAPGREWIGSECLVEARGLAKQGAEWRSLKGAANG
jgi:alkylation response protein AidB-like acyl-CoA dehydrogenase